MRYGNSAAQRQAKLTDEQILKLLELGEQIGDRIDTLDTSAIVDAIASVAGNSANMQSKKADLG